LESLLLDGKGNYVSTALFNGVVGHKIGRISESPRTTANCGNGCHPPPQLREQPKKDQHQHNSAKMSMPSEHQHTIRSATNLATTRAMGKKPSSSLFITEPAANTCVPVSQRRITSSTVCDFTPLGDLE
jgi:hypothetical protein